MGLFDNFTAGLNDLARWLVHHANDPQVSKREARRLRRGAAGALAQAHVDAQHAYHRVRLKAKARARRRATRQMHQRVRRQAA